MNRVLGKIGEARGVLEGIAKDVSELLSMAEITVPIVEDAVEKVKLRVREIERLFGPSEEKR